MPNKINWKSIDLNLLVVFSYLYRYQSVSIAAEKYCISQSAMSHSLSRLRTLFDDPLFERKTHKMMPTDYAHQIAPKVTTLLRTIQDDLLIKEPFEASEYQGTCRIGLTDYAEYIFAPLLYDAIFGSAPHAQICFINVNRHNYVEIAEKEKLDLIIGSISSINEHFSSQYLYTEKHVCLGNKALFSNNNSLSAEEFASVEHAMVSPDGKLVTQVDSQLLKRGLKRRVTIASQNFLTVRRLLEYQKLVAIVPQKMAQGYGLGEHVVVIPPPVPVDDFDISMLWYSQKSQDEKTVWLKNIVAEIIH